MKHILYCQSCHLPMVQSLDFGTESDGSINTDYCRHCYQNGSFTNPFLTLEEMQQRVRHLLELRDEDRANINVTVSNLPELKRWQRSHKF